MGHGGRRGCVCGRACESAEELELDAPPHAARFHVVHLWEEGPPRTPRWMGAEVRDEVVVAHEGALHQGSVEPTLWGNIFEGAPGSGARSLHGAMLLDARVTDAIVSDIAALASLDLPPAATPGPTE